MSRVEVLSAPVISLSSPISAPVIRTTAAAVEDKDSISLFANLPPLHAGHPEVHMRNGVMEAWQNQVEPDCEKAFFVGDLSVVYNQFMRWKKLLPRVEPFYGTWH